MSGLLIILASNAVVATGLLVVALTADRFVRWPAVRHLLWAAVLVQLLLPPVITVAITIPTAGTEDVAVELTAPEAVAESTAIISAASIPATESGLLTPAVALFAIELTGAALLLGLALIRSRGLFDLLRATETAPRELERRAQQLASELGLRKLPRLRITDERLVPMLIALPIPTVVLSRPLLESLDAQQIDALLAHELAHARRGDAWLRPVEVLATMFYWWLPTVWIARRRLRLAEEAACDALVLSVAPTAKRAYAESLLRTIELTAPAAAATFATGSASSRQMKERIMMIAKNSNSHAPRSALTIAAAAAVLAILIGPTWAPAQTADEQGPAATAGTSGTEQTSRDIERALIETRLEAFRIQNQIQRFEVRNEIARTARRLEAANAGVRVEDRDELARNLERLELETARLDIDLEIQELETQLALRSLATHRTGGSGAPASTDGQQ